MSFFDGTMVIHIPLVSPKTVVSNMADSNKKYRASLVAQCLRVHLPMQGMRVRAPVREDPHMPRSGWAREPWPLSLHVRSLRSATGEATTVRGPRTTKKINK